MIRKMALKRPECGWVEDGGTRCVAPATWEIRQSSSQAELEQQEPPAHVQRFYYCGRHVQQGERLRRLIERQT